jgi:hypothetical protein
MKYRLASLALGSVIAACGGEVEAGGSSTPSSGAPRAGSATTVDEGAREMSCAFLHGRATLTDYARSAYASSAFSFEFASQDPNVTHNEFDVLYEQDMFMVNMITDDRSGIADLGDVPLAAVPAQIEWDSYAKGQWHEHDAIQAHLDHTYFVRSVDGAGKIVAAFRVIALEPGVRVGIEWIRSSNPDAMTVPTHCFG